jgi:hypothetical protein
MPNSITLNRYYSTLSKPSPLDAKGQPKALNRDASGEREQRRSAADRRACQGSGGGAAGAALGGAGQPQSTAHSGPPDGAGGPFCML